MRFGRDTYRPCLTFVRTVNRRIEIDRDANDALLNHNVYREHYTCVCILTDQVGGGTAVGVGFWMRFDREPFLYVELFHAMPSSGPLVLLDRIPSVFIIVGGSVAILSFLGCCGACADNACFLSIVSDLNLFFL
jgi:Tetraspanin family